VATIVRQAWPSDEAIVAAILGEAAAWLIARNMSLWQPGELSADSITADVADGLYFLAECDGVPAGTMRFQLSDPLFWPDVPQDEAAYVHRLAVRRAFAGGKVSGALLDWAADRTAKLGRRYLRLDCDAARTRLQAVYERFGFRYHSDRQVGPHLVARYQRPVRLKANDMDDWFDSQKLHFAAQDGDAKQVEQLIKGGYSPNKFDELGKTPLHYAAAGEHFEVVSLLLAHGANVNAHHEPTISNTPIADVAQTCSLKMAQLLLDAGADPTIRGWMQLHAIHHAEKRKRGDGPKVYELLRRFLNK
jgi:GNAT superfamily N-acetyltransferase